MNKIQNEVYYAAALLNEAVNIFIDELQCYPSSVAIPVYNMTSYKRMRDMNDTVYEALRGYEEANPTS